MSSLTPINELKDVINKVQMKNFKLRPLGIDIQELNVYKNQKIDGTLNILVDVAYGISLGKPQSITCANRVTFYSENIPVIIIQLACTFYLDHNEWKALQNSTMKAFIIPKNFAKKLSEFVLNTARGILHVETEGTIYNNYPISLIDIDGQINEDAMIPFYTTGYNRPTMN